MDYQKIVDLVHAAKEIIFDPAKTHDVAEKGRADYVTGADRGVQNFLETELKVQTPDITLFAEEKVNERPDPLKSYWILDPIDGTTNLIHDYRFSAVSLALYENGEVTFGVVYNPFTEETYIAERGKGSFLNGMPIHPSGCGALRDALVSFGASPYEKQFASVLFPLYQRIYGQIADFRRGGSAELELCYVACGRLDAYFEADLKPWDYAAGQLIVREAGAMSTDFTGQTLPILTNANILAAAPGIYESMQKELKDVIIPAAR